MSIFGIGISGLAAAQAGLATTGHNITNANTAGYHRQSILQSAAVPMMTGAGFFGQGVQVDSVARAYNQFLETQLGQSQAQAGYYSAYDTQLGQIDNVVADTQAGLSPALQDFFSAAQAVATNPADVPSRQSLVSSGNALTARFNSIASRFDDLRTGVNSQLTTDVAQLNSYAQQIAALNNRIVVVQQNPGQAPNDLLDQRDVLIGKVNQLVGSTAVTQSDGTINLFIGTGQNLVVGNQAMTLVTAPALDDPQRLEVGYSTGGTTVLLNETNLQNGAVGGLLAFRANELDAAQNSLGRVAVGLAQTFNNQHQLGQDLNGALGGNFFAAPAPVVIPKSTNPAGGAVITASIVNAGALTTSDYQLAYDGLNYTVTRLSDNTSTSYATLPQTIDGITIAVASGAAAAGDSFLIEPTRNAARLIAMSISDPSKIAAAAPIRTAAAGSNAGTGTVSAGTVNAPPPPNANLLDTVTITFHTPADGKYDVTGPTAGLPATNQVYTPGANITFNGWTLQISGSPAAGDKFTVLPNSGGVADGRNAMLLAGLQTTNTLGAGTTTYQGAYSQMVSMIGTKTQQIDITSKAQNTLVDQATQAQQSLSGVNLDEEAANLLRYQQAYQASGKMIQIASTLFQTILDLGR
jgi:flagellar hook-associated protein 1 FlgK